MRTFLFVVAAISVLLGTPQDVFACICSKPSPLEALAEADFVFTGTVIEIDKHRVINYYLFLGSAV